MAKNSNYSNESILKLIKCKNDDEGQILIQKTNGELTVFVSTNFVPKLITRKKRITFSRRTNKKFAEVEEKAIKIFITRKLSQ